jgi:tRNA A-37 threonylcarbamoyl transferase component Bud32
MIGALLDGTYRVVELIGEGATGEVYLVEHIHIGRREAIKVLRPEVAADDRLAARFRREARAINRLRHPNIIGIYDFGRLPDGRLYLTMEHASGETLDLLLRRHGRLDVVRSLHLLHQLASAIDHAHSHGVVHRDLKPHNLVLVDAGTKHDVVKILDFGLAKVLNPAGGGDELTLRGEIFGTAEYMAPERLGGGPDDPRSDLYAIGCIAFELLTGKPPFTGPRALVMAAHMQSAPPSLGRAFPGIPGVLDVIVQQLLAKDPAARLQNGRQLINALEQVPGFPTRRAPRTGRMTLSPEGQVALAQARGVEVHDEITLQEKARAPKQMAYADTAAARTEEVRDEIFNALVDLAEETVDLHPGDAALALALVLVERARSDRGRFISDRAQLEERHATAVQSVREREGSLRFAIAELRYERQRKDPPPSATAAQDLDFQIAQLDGRVRELTLGLGHELAALDERGIELAAAEADAEGQWLDAHKRLRVALTDRMTALGAGAGDLAGKLAVVGAAVSEMLENPPG